MQASYLWLFPVLVFYIGYVIVELPSNIIIRKAGPAAWLSFLAVAWGVVTLAVGFIKNWESLVVLRVLLGIFEGVSLRGNRVRVLGTMPDANGMQGCLSRRNLFSLIVVQEV